MNNPALLLFRNFKDKQAKIAEITWRYIYHHSQLQVECQENGWSCYNMAEEVGARGRDKLLY